MKNNIYVILYTIIGFGGYNDIHHTSIICTGDYQLAHNRREIVAASD